MQTDEIRGNGHHVRGASRGREVVSDTESGSTLGVADVPHAAMMSAANARP